MYVCIHSLGREGCLWTEMSTSSIGGPTSSPARTEDLVVLEIFHAAHV